MEANDFQAKSKVLTTYTIKIALRIVCITLFFRKFATTNVILKTTLLFFRY